MNLELVTMNSELEMILEIVMIYDKYNTSVGKTKQIYSKILSLFIDQYHSYKLLQTECQEYDNEDDHRGHNGIIFIVFMSCFLAMYKIV